MTEKVRKKYNKNYLILKSSAASVVVECTCLAESIEIKRKINISELQQKKRKKFDCIIFSPLFLVINRSIGHCARPPIAYPLKALISLPERVKMQS